MRRSPGFLALCLAVIALVAAVAPLRSQVLVASPDGRNKVTVEIREGRLSYSLARDGRALILPSLLGFEFRGAPPLRDGLRITDTTRQSHDEWWTQPWGEVARVRDHHNELRVSVAGDGGTKPAVHPRGSAPSTTASASATSSPSSPASATYEITDELTEFALADNARAWWIPSNRPRIDRSEMLYSSAP